LMGFESLFTTELKKALEQHGIKALVSMVGRDVVIHISSEELKNILLNQMPLEWRHLMDVECGDVKIKLRLM